jgi:hypothetical protein
MALGVSVAPGVGYVAEGPFPANASGAGARFQLSQFIFGMELLQPVAPNRRAVIGKTIQQPVEGILQAMTKFLV